MTDQNSNQNSNAEHGQRAQVGIKLTMPALERLIGDDPEVRLALSQQICDNFAKQHLRSLINDPSWQLRIDTMQKNIRDQFEYMVVSMFRQHVANLGPFSDYRQITLHPHIVESLKKQLQQIVDTEFYKQVEEYRVATWPRIVEYIEQEVKSHIDKRIAAKVQERVDEILNNISTGLQEREAK